MQKSRTANICGYHGVYIAERGDKVIVVDVLSKRVYKDKKRATEVLPKNKLRPCQQKEC